MPIRKILVFGNPLVKKDSLPVKIIPDLQKVFPDIIFEQFDAAEELQKEGDEIFIIDSVEGIKNAMVINDIDMLLAGKACSLHDFDLGHTLKLLKKIRAIGRVTIFGVPMNISKKEAVCQLSTAIRSISA
jgi:Ni,Fe-hydrogenase maturation factor